MSLQQYNCLMSNGTLAKVGVIRADSPVLLSNFNRYSDIQALITVSEGNVDPGMTIWAGNARLFGTTLVNLGFNSVYYTGDGRARTFLFTGGKSITFGGTSGYESPYITYSAANSITVTGYRSGDGSSAIANGIGLTSEKVYDISVGDDIYSCLLSPEFYSYSNYAGDPIGIGDASNYSTSTGVRGPIRRTFPLHFNFGDGKTYASYYNHSDTDSTRKEAFYRTVDFFTDFWHGLRYLYTGMIAVGVGGIVTPENFFASANEPRMFAVTPDEHHAIHSVTAYNTLTNQQIPLQESGMDLVTGAKSYMFTMPAANVRIIVEFRSIEITIPVTVKYTSPRGKVFTTSFNLLYDDTEQREETAPPVEEQEGENQNE